jgi:hypothetical protein
MQPRPQPPASLLPGDRVGPWRIVDARGRGAKGRCPRVTINGGCWIKTKFDAKDCDKASYVHDGVCYEPAFPPPRPNTSSPTDGG